MVIRSGRSWLVALGLACTIAAGAAHAETYARRGVVEIGGSAGIAGASDYTRFELAPSVGIFVQDQFEVSLLTAMSHLRIGDGVDGGGASATEIKALVEPSFHLRLSQVAFGFVGLGVGINYVTEKAGLMLQPRVGANFPIGQSGILTPALAIAYSTVEALRTGDRLLPVRSSYGLQIGYTLMW